MPSLSPSTDKYQPLPFPGHRSTKVLLVDDDALVLRLLADVLTDDGYQVVACRSGESAAAAFRANGHIDLLVTDFQMPGMTGLELATLLTNKAPELPVLIVSGSAMDELPLWELWRKKWCFLPKPTSASLLLKTADQLCGSLSSCMQADVLRLMKPRS